MIFKETKKLKCLSFLLNFILVFGLIWLPVPTQIEMPGALKQLDLYLTIIFGIPLFIQLRSIFKDTGFSVDNFGFQLNIPPYNAQTIPWEQIQGLRFFKFFRMTYLLIDLKDSKQWLSEKRGFQKVRLLWIQRQFKTPIQVPLNHFKEKPIKIVELIHEILSIKNRL